MKENLNLKINCHSSICINDCVYIDPFNITKKVNNAKVIFVTHNHFDHLDITSILNVINSDTIIVCEKSCKEKLLKANIKNQIVAVEPYNNGFVCGVRYQTIPAYNYTHHHFRELNFVGYILTIENIRYTICGDTDATEELKEVKTDVLFVPIGGTYTMDAKEARELTNIINPKVVIPTHYNFIEGTAHKEAEKEFLNGLNKDIECLILVK